MAITVHVFLCSQRCVDIDQSTIFLKFGVECMSLDWHDGCECCQKDGLDFKFHFLTYVGNLHVVTTK